MILTVIASACVKMVSRNERKNRSCTVVVVLRASYVSLEGVAGVSSGSSSGSGGGSSKSGPRISWSAPRERRYSRRRRTSVSLMVTSTKTGWQQI